LKNEKKKRCIVQTKKEKRFRKISKEMNRLVIKIWNQNRSRDLIHKNGVEEVLMKTFGLKRDEISHVT
jgi:hypothetical protein